MLWCVCFYTNVSFTFIEENERTSEIVPQMLDKIGCIETMRYTLKNTERIDGVLLTGIQDIKYKASPRKCYIYMKSPNKGAEILFEEGKNNNQVIYNPHGFPFFRLNLDPVGLIMRRNNHHTVYEIGFGYIGGILSKNFEIMQQKFHWDGKILWKNRSCHKIIFDNPDFKFIPYTVMDNEDVISIARKFFISEYMIVEVNQDVDNYDDVQANQVIFIPTNYAKSIELYVDEESLLPVFLKIKDNRGLYEQYEYTNLIVNPDIPDGEFDESVLGKH